MIKKPSASSDKRPSLFVFCITRRLPHYSDFRICGPFARDKPPTEVPLFVLHRKLSILFIKLFYLVLLLYVFISVFEKLLCVFEFFKLHSGTVIQPYIADMLIRDLNFCAVRYPRYKNCVFLFYLFTAIVKPVVHFIPVERVYLHFQAALLLCFPDCRLLRAFSLLYMAFWQIQEALLSF